jgi:cytochrome c556
MKLSHKLLALGAVLAIGAATSIQASAADNEQVIKDRQALMKAQGKDLGAIRDYTQDKADLATAQTAGADLASRLAKVPDLFPKGTGPDAYPGKTNAKQAVWNEWDKFLAADKSAITAVDALNTALKGGDKTAITTAFGNMSRDFWGTTSSNPGACGACHGTFAQKPSS